MEKIRKPANTLVGLEHAITEGSPALARQRPPRQSRPSPQASVPAIRVLDIQQVPLTPPNSHRVSILISDDEGSLLAMGLVGGVIGLHSNGPYAGECLEEQVIELAESDVYGHGQREWFSCPGLDGNLCGSRRMKLYLPPGECTFACTECHAIAVPHAPSRPLHWRGDSLRQLVLHWREPVEMKTRKSA